MLSDLIKLSEELYELDMVDESIKIDEMIHKIYGSPVDQGIEAPSLDKGDQNNYRDYSRSLYEIILKNASAKEFNEDVASIIYETLDSSDIEEIIDYLKEYIE